MAIVTVEKTDTFDIWRQKTNTISINIGDLDLLTTPSATDIVDAINSLMEYAEDNTRRSIIIGLALN